MKIGIWVAVALFGLAGTANAGCLTKISPGTGIDCYPLWKDAGVVEQIERTRQAALDDRAALAKPKRQPAIQNWPAPPTRFSGGVQMDERSGSTVDGFRVVENGETRSEVIINHRPRNA